MQRTVFEILTGVVLGRICFILYVLAPKPLGNPQIVASFLSS
jgi:hypothetical protein